MNGGFRYDDPRGEQGPVTAVRFKRTSGGRFTIESAVLGAKGPVEVVPPNPGTDAFMTLKLGLAPEAGDRYCVQYGPESDIRNDGVFFSAKNPVEKGCPTTTTTTSTTTTTYRTVRLPQSTVLRRCRVRRRVGVQWGGVRTLRLAGRSVLQWVCISAPMTRCVRAGVCLPNCSAGCFPGCTCF
jgi:hypothetical protein